ncbi:hypothetical protein SUDANB105_03666 [Streptomyces sp. enrichment culture]|uniref:acyl-CoA dehydrogenase family protein n=1 Tax=Streptomyces sp. enrichment culture TaxID=1795815 RepID=UPI003F5716ED
MDFAFSEEQQAAAEAARGVFADVVPDSVPSPTLTRGAVAEDFDRALWARLAATDLLGLLLAPEHGGAGLDPIAAPGVRADHRLPPDRRRRSLWQAAWRIGTCAHGALPASGDVAVAKIRAAEGVRRVVQTAQHLHGGFGADVEYPLHRYRAWAKHLELSLGPAAAHEDTLGDLLAAHQLA